MARYRSPRRPAPAGTVEPAGIVALVDTAAPAGTAVLVDIAALADTAAAAGARSVRPAPADPARPPSGWAAAPPHKECHKESRTGRCPGCMLQRRRPPRSEPPNAMPDPRPTLLFHA